MKYDYFKKDNFVFKKFPKEDYWEYGLCEYTILELKYHIFRETIILVEKVLFDHFLAHESQKSRIFKDFQGFRKNHDFHQKPWF